MRHRRCGVTGELARKQTTESIHFPVSGEVTGSRDHKCEPFCTKTHTRTHTQIFHSSPCGQTHLKGNVPESGTEQFLMACPSHYACSTRSCLCLYVQVCVTTHYEILIARAEKVTDELIWKRNSLSRGSDRFLRRLFVAAFQRNTTSLEICFLAFILLTLCKAKQ